MKVKKEKSAKKSVKPSAELQRLVNEIEEFFETHDTLELEDVAAHGLDSLAALAGDMAEQGF
jgi:hypothetical protein